MLFYMFVYCRFATLPETKLQIFLYTVQTCVGQDIQSLQAAKQLFTILVVPVAKKLFTYIKII